MGKHQPALLGGILIGVLSALPVVGALNACCCLWVVLGGMLTVYLQQQQKPEPVETADAVIGGLLAGLIGAVIMALVQALMVSITGPVTQQALQQALQDNPEVPAEAREMLLRLFSGQGVVLFVLAIAIPLYAVFAMLGSLLGLALFRKKTPPAPPAPSIQV
ncbi:MAG: hypothetical protein R2752_03485 [Vicinamibacterales bacterium]